MIRQEVRNVDNKRIFDICYKDGEEVIEVKQKNGYINIPLKLLNLQIEDFKQKVKKYSY